MNSTLFVCNAILNFHFPFRNSKGSEKLKKKGGKGLNGRIRKGRGERRRRDMLNKWKRRNDMRKRRRKNELWRRGNERKERGGKESWRRLATERNWRRKD